MAAPGTKPLPGQTEQEASRWVREMFGRLAPRYDLINRASTFQFDRIWRWRTARHLKPLLDPHARVLDLCCGTGDLLRALERQAPAHYFGADFSHPMLRRTAKKTSAPLVEADGLNVPVPDATFDLVTLGFGFRNFANYRHGLDELLRILKPGGTVAILELTTSPYWATRFFVNNWHRFVMGPMGRAVSGDDCAYDYLPSSIQRFLTAPELEIAMRDAGFVETSHRYFDAGIVALHVGRKSNK